MYVIKDSTDANVVDEATREVAEYMHGVKASPETESGFMTLGHRMDADRKASREEGLVLALYKLIRLKMVKSKLKAQLSVLE